MKINKKILFITLGIVLIIIGVYYWINKKNVSYNLVLSKPFANNVSNPEMISDDKFYYFSGSSFVEFNLTNYSTKNLTPFYRLPNVTTVKWSEESAVFTANNYSPGDQLYDVLTQKGFSTNKSYWWIVNFKSGVIELLGDNDSIAGVIWRYNSKDWLVEIRKEEPKGLEFWQNYPSTNIVKLVTSDQISYGIWADNSSLLGVLKDNNHSSIIYKNPIGSLSQNKLYELGRSETIISNSTGDAIIYNDTSKNIDPEDISGEFVYQIIGKDRNVVAIDFNNMYKWSFFANNWVTLPNQGKMSGYLSFNGRFGPYDLRVNGKFDKDFIDVSVGSNNLVMVDENKKAYYASEKNIDVKEAVSQDSLIKDAQNTIYENGFTISYYSETDEFQVLIQKQPVSKIQNEVSEYLKNRYGLDINQINIIWLVDDSIYPNT